MTLERREFARLLRKHPTRAEELLWERLRGSRFSGAKFRRQVPFGPYVIDFYCHAAKLAVNPRTAIRGDGKQHQWFFRVRRRTN
jgi:very-short-patch-repair endonuclease